MTLELTARQRSLGICSKWRNGFAGVNHNKSRGAEIRRAVAEMWAFGGMDCVDPHTLSYEQVPEFLSQEANLDRFRGQWKSDVFLVGGGWPICAMEEIETGAMTWGEHG